MATTKAQGFCRRLGHFIDGLALSVSERYAPFVTASFLRSTLTFTKINTHITSTPKQTGGRRGRRSRLHGLRPAGAASCRLWPGCLADLPLGLEEGHHRLARSPLERHSRRPARQVSGGRQLSLAFGLVYMGLQVLLLFLLQQPLCFPRCQEVDRHPMLELFRVDAPVFSLCFDLNVLLLILCTLAGRRSWQTWSTSLSSCAATSCMTKVRR